MKMYLAMVDGKSFGVFSTQKKAEDWGKTRRPCEIKVYECEVDDPGEWKRVQHLVLDQGG